MKCLASWPLQATEAVKYIHSKGVIHGDLGSHNFLVQSDGTLALADFGGSASMAVRNSIKIMIAYH